jgi:hypothetical protein
MEANSAPLPPQESYQRTGCIDIGGQMAGATIPPIMGESRQIELGSLTLRDDGILHTVFDFDGRPTLRAANEYIETRRSLVGDRSVPVLIEIVRITFVERTIREFFMQEVGRPPCRAIVTDEPTFISLFRTFQLVDPAGTPSAVFATVDQALAWIEARREDPPDRDESE